MRVSRLVAGTCAACARRIRACHGFDNTIVDLTLGFRIKHGPAIDEFAAAREADALIKDFAVRQGPVPSKRRR